MVFPCDPPGSTRERKGFAINRGLREVWENPSARWISGCPGIRSRGLQAAAEGFQILNAFPEGNGDPCYPARTPIAVSGGVRDDSLILERWSGLAKTAPETDKCGPVIFNRNRGRQGTRMTGRY